MKHTLFTLFLLSFLLGIILRMININQPLLEYNTTRQAQTAMITKNYILNKLHFLYPTIYNYSGENPTYLMQEFPLITAPVAIACYLIGTIPDWLLRIPSLFSFIMATFFLFKLVELCWNRKLAVISSCIFIFSPLSILMSRTFQPEMPMLFFLLMMFYFLWKWVYDDNIYSLIFSAFSFMCCILLKVTNLYLLLPILYIILSNKKKIDYRLFNFIVAFVLAFLPVLWWYGYHCPKIRHLFPNQYDVIFNIHYQTIFTKKYLTNFNFYLRLIVHIIRTAFTPLVSIAFIIGLLIRHRTNEEKFLFFWLCGVIIFLLSFPSVTDHEYYKLVIVPIGAIYAARGVSIFLNKNKNYFKLIIIYSSILSFIFSLRIVYPYLINKAYFKNTLLAGKVIDEVSFKDDLIVVAHESGSGLLYYCNRRGWGLKIPAIIKKRWDKDASPKNLDEQNYEAITSLEDYRRKNAKYFVTVDMEKFNKSHKFREYMFKNYILLRHEPDKYIIFKLENKR
ncbi:MAG: glycosyltransferase family 39 protein [Patescibacteria group bacterium]